MNASRLSDDVVERLAAVLAEVLATGSPDPSSPSEPSEASGAEVRRLALRGAAAILPAVLAMQQVQEWVRTRGGVAWGGLLHRRCVMVPPPLRVDAAGPPFSVGGTTVRRADRSGWELLRATTEVSAGGCHWQGTHDLARRTSVHWAAATGAGKLTDPGAGFDPPSGGRFYRLAYRDIRSWAEATEDRNPIHLLPGGAVEAGLRTGPDDVVAHGLLVAALSLAVVQPSTDRRISLRFIGSVDVPASPRNEVEAWATVAVEPGTGVVIQDRCPVLRRG
ncbi:MaoC/PaaZ C-terminal domain-containing protein [uncultured Actinomyces sp.]|uniref:MaoC/PaaZ C-terminal domain-containing protein n=1 Tax=uncultured Actinomyces sp. TaxID=249061 RepID=UPI0025F82378|nr:MaoC/PaaZ C-terminal domain-containing protein [uncultured Actinomyces sp.]